MASATLLRATPHHILQGGALQLQMSGAILSVWAQQWEPSILSLSKKEAVHMTVPWRRMKDLSRTYPVTCWICAHWYPQIRMARLSLGHHPRWQKKAYLRQMASPALEYGSKGPSSCAPCLRELFASLTPRR